MKKSFIERSTVTTSPSDFYGKNMKKLRTFLLFFANHYRTYLEKPRTAVGWRGLVSDPTLTGSEDMARGLALGRRVLLEALTRALGRFVPPRGV